MNIDECENEPCQNGGTCNDLNAGYNCTCPAGYSGSHCEEDVNECVDTPCENGATCVNLPGTYNCSCASGYEGCCM